jgi:hypothetical protein
MINLESKLHLLEHYIAGSLGFNSVQIGNKDFKLFEKVSPLAIVGPAIHSPESTLVDTANLRTMITLLSKT